MRKRVCLLLSLLLLFSMLPGGAMAYGRGAPGPGPAAAAALDDYYFWIDQNNELVVTDPKDTSRGGTLPGGREVMEAAWVVPRYLTARLDEKGNVILTVQDIWTEELTVELTYTKAQCDEALTYERRIFPRQEATNGTVHLGLFDVAGGRASVITVGNCILTDAPWSGNLTLYPYNGKTFLLQDKENFTLYASEDGVIWNQLSDPFFSIRGSADEVAQGYIGVTYGMAWTGTEYLACCRMAEGLHGMMGMRGGVWYDPSSTQVAVLDEDFTLKHTYNFGRQVEKVGCYGGVYYAQVADGEGVSVREYDPKGPATLYRSTDGGKTWEKTEILQILEALKALQ